MTFTNIVDGYPGDPAVVMANFKHVNYGNPLLPVNSSGVGVDNTIALGSSANRFSATYTNGIASGESNASLLKWATVPLPGLDLSVGVDGSTGNIGAKTFTVNMSAYVPDVKKILYMELLIISDDATKVLLPMRTQNTSNKSGTDNTFDAFLITLSPVTPINASTKVATFQVSNRADQGTHPFVDDATNWDGTSTSRGNLFVAYFT